MKLTILEYAEKQVKIAVPKHIAIISDFVKFVASEAEEPTDFEDGYKYLKNYYEKKANEEFDEDDLWLDGFMLHDEDIQDYCCFYKFKLSLYDNKSVP